MNKTLFWLLNKIATRDEIKTYLGHGDFTCERGWWLFGKWWFSYDKPKLPRFRHGPKVYSKDDPRLKFQEEEIRAVSYLADAATAALEKGEK